MPLIDRVKERTKSELGDAELQALIDEASGEIIRRYGQLGEPMTELHPGGFISLIPNHPIDPAEDITITETSGATAIELDPTDFRVLTGNRMLQRLATGANPRSVWGDDVELEYTPASDQLQRDEVTIKLVQLSIQYEGVQSDSIDGYASSHLDYQAERERLLASLDRSIKMA